MTTHSFLVNCETFLQGLAAHPTQAGLTLFGLVLLLLVMRIPSGRPVPFTFHIVLLMLIPAVIGGVAYSSFSAALCCGLFAVAVLAVDEVYHGLYPAFDVVLLVKDLFFISRWFAKKVKA